MRVERLDLIGFKSFGDRTVFNLHPGITCIVGPNGCGKSNVVDAVKWVLGEQSAKSLRGGKMEEVIFAGSQNKKPRGMSEVSLIISGLGTSGNGGDRLTTVTRRLYRSGDSEYLLNRNACRLRDIRDIFLDTGLEVKSYSILEQDRIGAILSARPEERRFLIEEVAGVVKYKVRRNEAQSKLDSSRSNLQRISDIVAEVRRQINALDRQVKKAERYKRLSEELKGIELRMARRDHDALSAELAEIQELHGRTREEHAAGRAELSEREAEVETQRIELLEREKALEARREELQAVERRMAEAERQMAVCRTEAGNLREYAEKLREQETENRLKREEGERKKAGVAEAGQALDRELEALSRGVEETAATLKAVEERVSERERVLDTRRREAFRAAEELGHLRNELNKQTGALEALESRQAALAREDGEVRSSLEASTGELRRVEAGMLDRNIELLAIRDEKNALAAEVEALRERLDALRTGAATVREEVASMGSRLDSLREMVFSETSEADLRENAALLAAVSDVIEVSREHERAVESALGEIINGFVVRGYDEVRQAVSVLKERGLGRTVFVPVEGAGQRPVPALPDGAVAWVSDLVRAEDEYAGVVRGLLGSVAVMRDLDGALAARTSGATLVTLEGEVVHPSGAVSAGAGTGILALKRQMRELDSDIRTKRERIALLDQESTSARDALRGKEEALRGASEREVECERELSLLRLTAERVSAEVERLNRKLAQVNIETDEAAREREALEEAVAGQEAGIGRAETARQEAGEAITAVEREIANLRAEAEQRRAESVEARLSLNSRTERRASLRSEEESLAALLRELEEKEELLGRDAARTADRIREREAEERSGREALAALAVQADELSRQVSAERSVLDEEGEELRSRERGMKELRLRIEEAAQRLSDLDVRRAEHGLRIENLVGTIRNTYAVELASHEAEPVTPDDEERLPELKRKIESMGPVSLGSIEEYEELKERYDFLTKQQEDLQRSISELEEAIRRINATTRKRLREAYEALKVKFAEVFVSLFGGGRAELVLTDEHNILETGIDIIAQPPGKRFQNISLLSGGEKTLTALALLFASFLIKPTPLCILDEADAALDESNTVKFAQMIKDLAREIQFIVVTHNRVTMEAADYLYGVTMEEPGNSKIISIELAEA